MRTHLEYEELDVSGRVVSDVVMDSCMKLIVRHWPVVRVAQFLQ